MERHEYGKTRPSHQRFHAAFLSQYAPPLTMAFQEVLMVIEKEIIDPQ